MMHSGSLPGVQVHCTCSQILVDWVRICEKSIRSAYLMMLIPRPPYTIHIANTNYKIHQSQTIPWRYRHGYHYIITCLFPGYNSVQQNSRPSVSVITSSKYIYMSTTRLLPDASVPPSPEVQSIDAQYFQNKQVSKLSKLSGTKRELQWKLERSCTLERFKTTP